MLPSGPCSHTMICRDSLFTQQHYRLLLLFLTNYVTYTAINIERKGYNLLRSIYHHYSLPQTTEIAFAKYCQEILFGFILSTVCCEFTDNGLRYMITDADQ
jgi:hypothetical protein